MGGLRGCRGGRGGAVLPPGRSVSPASLQGLTGILLSCQGRVMGAKANRGAAEVSALTNMEPLKGLIGLWKKLRQQK